MSDLCMACEGSPKAPNDPCAVCGKASVPQDVREAVANVVGYHLAAVVSGNNQPCMSGDPRDRIGPGKRRWFDDACRGAADAAIAALRGRGWQRVPEGWKLVPVEPDRAIINAGIECATSVMLSRDYSWADYMRDLWKRMLSAAPEPPA